ncbi:uncharacterized protein BDW43DRAFT_234683 [Aspergillus alliaceus]|uniref:uncharacterized protein n=1 Tax=Petromyces alliaceus TaxID=209559 RepID=UPI0012A43CFB|nr:uncharacterized protein BDW43DRAFT_234683 [Aspergillus alliaceus]KAB8227924.1 hypothetical protein BDW43DRAFT_234683 [Aspergillus alliaceus]
MTGPSVVMELHRDSILSSRASTKTNASLSVVSDHSAYTSQSPAADISDLSDTTPHPRGVSPAETIQCDETVVEDAINEVASRGDQAEYLSNKAVLTQSVQNDRPSIEKSSPPSDAEDNVSKEVRPSVLSRPNHQSCPIGLSEIPLPCTRSLRPRPNTNADKISKEVRLPELSHSNHQSRPIGPLKMPSKRTRSLRPRPNIHIDRPERLPSVSVVIPVRESDRLMASATKDPPIQVRRHVQQDGSGDNNTNSSTAAPDFNNDRSCSEIERPRKRCKHAVRPRKAAETDSTSTNHAIRETKNSFRNSSGSGFGTPDEAQEVFGRGILRIQPHGPRHTYFITFLPDNVYHLPPRPDMPPRQSSCPEGRPQSQSSRQTIHRRRHKRSPYSPAENQLLTELRSRRCLPWREVAKHFKHRTQASLQVQYSKIRSESLDKI